MSLDSSKKVPVLRFRDDEGKEYPDWKIRLLEDFVKFSKGRGISRADITDDGSYKCIRYGELYTLYKETISDVFSKTNVPVSQLFLSQKYDVVIPASGETALDIVSASCVLISGVALGGDVNVLRSQQNGIFLAYYLNSKRRGISRFAQGISVIHLYAVHLKRIPIALPCIQEQQKIASFLSSIDTRIEQLEKKKSLFEQYKIGLMQKLFSQETRFRDDQGEEYPEWEEISLEEILKYEQPTAYIVSNTDYSNEYETPVLTAGKTFVLGYTDDTEGLFLNHLPVILFDDFTTATKFVDFPFKVKSSAIKILLPRLEDVSMTFVYEAMKRIRFPLGEHKRYWISEYQKEKISYPNREERQKIANFLSSVDRKIKLISEQIEITREFKKGLLQQMFV